MTINPLEPRATSSGGTTTRGTTFWRGFVGLKWSVDFLGFQATHASVYENRYLHLNVRFMRSLILVFTLVSTTVAAQKEIYIPLEWQAGSLDYSLDRSVESENFIVFWGPLAGNDPTQASSDIAFDPQQILNTAEELYRFYIDTIHFLNDDAGFLSQYKIILVMLHTWSGLEGWAFGGNYDGIVGAMWMHPHAASSGPTLAHEFTHTLQNYAWMMNPGRGFIDSSYVGFFWETHAEFMALQKFPSVALEFDMARWLNTSHFHWSSTRHHYQAFAFLQFIKELDGITMINRLWSESLIGEHPLQTYMRLKNISQEEVNNLFAQHAMKNVVWDYEIGDLLRERVSTLPDVFVAHQTIIPERIDSARHLFGIQNHLAPQDYGYNIIRLYPEEVLGCDKRVVFLHLKAETLWPDYDQGELLYGFVAVDEHGSPRYSEIYNYASGEVIFEMEDDETQLYLVVTGAPNEHHNYNWEIGFPKVYRYPYQFILRNAVPDGYQSGFRQNPEVPGNHHINGGGFVAATAYADPSAYIGPHAQVLDQAQVKENARIEDYAIIKHSAIIEDSAVIKGLSIIGEATHVYGNATVSGQAHVYGVSEVFDHATATDNAQIFNTRVYENAKLTGNTFTWGANLYGDILLGGDAEFFSECSDGTYMQVEDAYGRNCDGLDDHFANVDVTDQFFQPKFRNEFTLVCDQLLENVYNEIYVTLCPDEAFYFNGMQLTKGTHEFTFERPGQPDSIIIILIMTPIRPTFTFENEICEGDTLQFVPFIWQSDTLITFPGVHQFFEEGFHTLYYKYADCLDSMVFELIYIDVIIEVEQNGEQLTATNQNAEYQWYDCSTGLPIPGAIHRTFTPELTGMYQLQLTTLDGCSGFSECFEVVIVGTENPTAADFTFSPNPATDFVRITINNLSLNAHTVEVLNMFGKMIIKRVKINQTNYLLDLSAFPGGIYVIKMTDQTGRSSSNTFVKI